MRSKLFDQHASVLKLYLYGYLHRIRSSRRLAAECVRNLEVMWLLQGLKPGYKTIADFRKDNRKPVFRQFVLLCRKLDLFGRELLAVDGTRLKAVNSTDRNFTRDKLVKMIRSADERLADYLSRLDRTDAEEDGASGRADCFLAAPRFRQTSDSLRLCQAIVKHFFIHIENWL